MSQIKIIDNKKFIKLNTLKDTYILQSDWDKIIKKQNYYEMTELENKFFMKNILSNDCLFYRKSKIDNNYYNLKLFQTDYDNNYTYELVSQLQAKRKENKNDNNSSNLLFLRKIYSGNENKPLKFKNQLLEQVQYFPDCSPSNIFDQHHPAFNKNGSIGKKGNEPSYYNNHLNLLNINNNLRDIYVEGVNQFLLCQILPTTHHKNIHDNFYEDNIERYLTYPKDYGTSYHFRSKKNYLKVINFICSYGYDYKELYEYEDLMNLLSSTKVHKKT